MLAHLEQMALLEVDLELEQMDLMVAHMEQMGLMVAHLELMDPTLDLWVQEGPIVDHLLDH